MKKTIDIDEFLKLKEKPALQVFIFLLDGELSYLEYDTSWLGYIGRPIYLVRMNEEEFRMMDMAIHPKILVTRKGRELCEMNGLPKMEVLKRKIQNL
jgi:hypothetical protein